MMQGHDYKLYSNVSCADVRKFFFNQQVIFVNLLLNGTSALFRPLVPRIFEIEHMRHVKNDL